MINPFREVNWHPDRTQKQAFALSLIIGFPALALILYTARGVFIGHWSLAPALWIGAGGCLAGVLFRLLPSIVKPFYIAWYGVACAIGIVVANSLMALFYYALLSPIGLARRLFSSSFQPLNSKAASYWTDSKPIHDPRRYYRPF